MMDDVINRGNNIAEENIKGHGRPGTDMYGEFSDNVLNAEDLEKDLKNLTQEEREKRMKEMDKVIDGDLK